MSSTPMMTKTIEQNKQVVRQFVEDYLNTGRIAEGAMFFDPKFVEHAAPPSYTSTFEGVNRFFTELRAAFPDFKYTIDDTIAEGDYVVQRTTGQGTMKGEFQGMKPTGKHAVWIEIHIVRLANGKIIEHWASVDQLGMLTQLGFVPAPGAH
ncbi:MAG: ester cyclase [Chloroflexi bacterium]|nr:ester cyclase [Chloroflexota bacterium]